MRRCPVRPTSAPTSTTTPVRAPRRQRPARPAHPRARRSPRRPPRAPASPCAGAARAPTYAAGPRSQRAHGRAGARWRPPPAAAAGRFAARAGHTYSLPGGGDGIHGFSMLTTVVPERRPARRRPLQPRTGRPCARRGAWQGQAIQSSTPRGELLAALPRRDAQPDRRADGAGRHPARHPGPQDPHAASARRPAAPPAHPDHLPRRGRHAPPAAAGAERTGRARGLRDRGRTG